MRWLAGALALLGLAACGSAAESSADAGAACPAFVATACGAAPPTYEADIAPLFARTCLTCHAPGGQSADRDLTTAKNVHRLGTTVLAQVQGCLMPPEDAGPSLTAEERALVLQWFACGALDQ